MNKVNSNTICATIGLDLQKNSFSNDVSLIQIRDLSHLDYILYKKPKVCVLKSFDESSKNEHVINEIKMKSPETRIVLFGIKRDQVRGSIAKLVDEFLDASTSIKALEISVERLLFSANYGETFLEGIEIKSENRGFLPTFILFGSITIVGLVFLLANLV